MKRALVVGIAAVATATTVAFAVPAQANAPAHPAPGVAIGTPSTIVGGLTSPLSFDIDAHGDAVVSQNFIGQLTRVAPDGTETTLATAPTGEEIGAVSTRGDTVFYAQDDQPNEVAHLMVLQPGGTPRVLADLGAYERTANPDQRNHYGFVGLDPSCTAQFDPTGETGPASYDGLVDTHPYASLALRDGVYVADAGGNDLVKVGYDGHVSTVAVLPPQAPVVVSAAVAAENGLPTCVAGHQYVAEPVPTDVERGPGGLLFVSTLPGGPEGPSLGARGGVYAVDPATGAVRQVVSGLADVTGIAVDQRSGIVVAAELYGGPDATGQVSVVQPWTNRVLARYPVTSPAAIELRGGTLYGTTNAVVPDATGAPQPIGTLLRAPLWQGHARWGDDGAGSAR